MNGEPACWACLNPLKEPYSVNIDGVNEIICLKCWGSMSVFQRMILAIALNGVDDGGIGLPDISAAFAEGVMKVIFSKNYPGSQHDPERPKEENENDPKVETEDHPGEAPPPHV